MRHAQADFSQAFAVITGNDRSQAAGMVLEAGTSTGGPDNRHPGSDQWLYVASGEGSAVVKGELHTLRPGTVLLIERGESHEIRAGEDGRLETLNFYVPPAYSSSGDALSGAGKS